MWLVDVVGMYTLISSNSSNLRLSENDCRLAKKSHQEGHSKILSAVIT